MISGRDGGEHGVVFVSFANFRERRVSIEHIKSKFATSGNLGILFVYTYLH